MYYHTAEEYAERLNEIDFEIAKLEVERKYIRDVQDLYAQRFTSAPEPAENNDSSNGVKRSERILAIIQNNPGINGQTVRELLGEETVSQTQISNALSSLRLSKKIENRGKSGLAARWYVKK